jgi:hypothetical protein
VNRDEADKMGSVSISLVAAVSSVGFGDGATVCRTMIEDDLSRVVVVVDSGGLGEISIVNESTALVTLGLSIDDEEVAWARLVVSST